MLRSIWEETKSSFRVGNMTTKLLIVNIGVWVLLNGVKLAVWFMSFGHNSGWDFLNTVQTWFACSGYWKTVLFKPWTLITCMFMHISFMHLAGNMMWLFLFGRIVGDLIGDKKVLPIYLMGGLVGSLAFLIYATLAVPTEVFALGASAAVMALGGAALILAPDYRIYLFILGEVRLKYVVVLLIFLDLISISSLDNTGGHFAHLGGFLFGMLYISRLREGQDLSEPVNDFLSSITGFFGRKSSVISGKSKSQGAFNRRSTAGKPSTDASSADLNYQEKLDAILDKIKEKGYENLTAEEKEFLFNASKKS